MVSLQSVELIQLQTKIQTEQYKCPKGTTKKLGILAKFLQAGTQT